MSGNRVVVPRGTPFEGVVVESKSSGRFRGRALLEVTLRSFRMHGTTYRIATAPDALGCVALRSPVAHAEQHVED